MGLVVGCLQFSPVFGRPLESISKVDTILSEKQIFNLDLLILPEMAFYGYMFDNRETVCNFAEVGNEGLSIRWAVSKALLYRCYVIVGFPEKNNDSLYNSLCLVNREGEIVKVYRKTFLYETDKLWAFEGSGFCSIETDIGKIGLSICMDLNPKDFVASWDAFELGKFHQNAKTNILVCIMAWRKTKITDRHDPEYYMNYWLNRLGPFIDTESAFLVCNRTGTESGIQFCGCSSGFTLGSNFCLLNNLGEIEESLLIMTF